MNGRMKRMGLGIGVGLILISGGIWAQENEEDADDPLLPQLTSREVEIRGELEISFPSMQRQPLTGFNPPPRIYEVPRERSPHVGMYKQRTADLPTTDLMAPSPPAVAVLTADDPTRGELLVGFGRYLSRDVIGRFNLPVGSQTTLTAGGTYTGHGSYKPFPNQEEELEAPVQSLDARAGLFTQQEGFQAGVEVDGFFDDYALYGMAAAGLGDAPLPDRRGSGIGGTVYLQSRPGAPTAFDLRGRYGGSIYEVVAEDLTEDERLERSDKRLDLSARLGRQFGTSRILLDGTVTAGGLDADPAFGSDHLSYGAGGALRIQASEAAILTIGARLLGYEASAKNRFGDPNVGEAQEALYLAPWLRIDYFLNQETRLYVRNAPRLEAHGLADVMRLNPYVVPEPALQPSLSTADVEGGVIYYTGAFRLSAFAGYQRWPSFLYFQEAVAVPGLTGSRGFFDARYDEAEILRGGAEIAISIPGGFSASAGVTLQDGRLVEPDVTIPYFADVVGRVQVSYPFSRQRGLIQVTGRFEGVYDNTDLLGQTQEDVPEELGGFLDLDVEGAYMVLESLGLYARIESLGTPQYARWAGYPAPTWIARGGIKLRW